MAELVALVAIAGLLGAAGAAWYLWRAISWHPQCGVAPIRVEQRPAGRAGTGRPGPGAAGGHFERWPAMGTPGSWQSAGRWASRPATGGSGEWAPTSHSKSWPAERSSRSGGAGSWLEPSWMAESRTGAWTAPARSGATPNGS